MNEFMCVAERKYAYKLEGRTIHLNEQLRLVKHYKAAFRQFNSVHSHIFQVTKESIRLFKCSFGVSKPVKDRATRASRAMHTLTALATKN